MNDYRMLNFTESSFFINPDVKKHIFLSVLKKPNVQETVHEG